MYVHQASQQHHPQYVLQRPKLPQVNQGYTGPVQLPSQQVYPVGTEEQQAQHQVIVMQSHAQPQTLIYANYNWRNSYIVGIVHIVIGLLCIAIGGAAIGSQAWGYQIGHGTWGGVMFGITGTLGITSSKIKDHCNIVSHLCLAFISMVIAMIGSVLSLIGCIEDLYYWKRSIVTTHLAINGVLACLFGLEIAMSIWSGVISSVLFGASGSCCYPCGCYEYYEGQNVRCISTPPRQFGVPVAVLANVAASQQAPQITCISAQQTGTGDDLPPKYTSGE